MTATVDTAHVRNSVGAARGLREAILAGGPDTEAYLQGQLSQDVASMAPGDSRWSLLLQPQGKISAWLRVTRLDDASFLLDVDQGHADEVITRLERFKLRTACELSMLDHQSLTLIGPDAMSTTVEGGEIEIHDSWAGLPVVVVFGPAPNAAVPEIDAETAAVLRIEAGRPAMGSELDESTIPAAAGIVEQSVSFTKGCYTGQELVARIDSRGNNVPRRLVGVVLDGDATPALGEALLHGGASVGAVTSSGWSSALGAPVALAYVSRGVDDDATVEVAGAPATVRALPLVTA